MRVAICGYGWAGSLLAHALSKEHDVVVYEKNPTIRAVCACGIPIEAFQEIAEQCDLTAGDYVFWRSRKLILDFQKKQRRVSMTGLCTFNKLAFMKQLFKQTKAEFHFGETLQSFNSFDLIVDATGTRALLGRTQSDKFFSTYQVLAKFDSLPFPDFYMYVPTGKDAEYTKYLWMFPLSARMAYVGCGSIKGTIAYSLTHQFLKEHNAEIIEEQAKVLRLNPPKESQPFYIDKIVGVGNSIGAITSFGEGNQLAAETVKLLTQNLTNLQTYKKQILQQLKWLQDDYKAYNGITQNKTLKTTYYMLKIQNIYRRRLKTSIMLL